MKSVPLLRRRRTASPAGPSVPPATFERRLRVRLHRRRIDHELAHGGQSDALEDRALRASQLVDMVTRRRLARSIRRLVKDAEHPAALLCSAVPLCRTAVWPWREGLLGLAERLEHPGPINPCGVARVLELLTDGTGPLYNPGAARSMGEAVWRIADGLQHRDDSPDSSR
jgi:hypothetical protein